MMAREGSDLRAYNMGFAAGENAARWAIQDLWGGRCSDEVERAESFLRAYDDGGDLGGLCEPNLSGEYADDPTRQTLADDLGIDDPDEIDDACSAWEDGASSGYWDTLCESARYMVAPDDDAQARARNGRAPNV